MACKKCKCKKEEYTYRSEYVHTLDTFHVWDNEIYICGRDNEGEDIQLVFRANEFLDFVDIGSVREAVIKYYSELNREEAENLKKSKQK